MPGLKTNEREGTRAVLRHARLSPYKVREVLDLVRGKPVHEAEDILRFSERDAAMVVYKVLRSAVANAENNDELDPEELFVSACFADEGTTIKRWRPRARGRATRIRKRTSHITVIVSRMPEVQLQRMQARRRAEQLAQRARRVAGARRAEGDQRPRAERRHGPSQEELDELEVAAAEEAAAAEAAEAGEATQTAEATEEADTAEAGETVAAGDTAEVTDGAEAAEAESAEAAEADTEAAETTEAAEAAEDETARAEVEEPSQDAAPRKDAPADDKKDEH
jgi:large subunit ribosomal protein L22